MPLTLLLAGWLVIAGMPAIAGADVRVWEAPLAIPTYELGPPDPNPPFLAGPRHPSNPIYPYTLLDSLTKNRVEKSYKAVYLENEYLRVTVLPEFGGKLYSIFDKTSNSEVLYTNHVIKYGLVALRGAWISGGIEWNFPNGHTHTTVSPIDYVIRNEPGGVASVTVGNTERVQRMQWAVTIRLRPGWKYVETEVTLNNRRDIQGRYWFWATASAPATDDLRFVYPMREAYPHAFWPVYSFPKYQGVDVGTYREVKHALSLFARDSRRDFMGVYYEKADHGVIHVADHRKVLGKKTWTWGTDEDGKIWIDKLTDQDGQYVEFQAGRFETQIQREFMAPHTVDHFTEYWYPVRGLGGSFDEANRNAALHVTREGGSVRIWISANAAFPKASVSIGLPGQTPLVSAGAALDPAKAYSKSFELPAETAGKPLAITIANGAETLLSYRTDTPIDGNPDFKPATPPPPVPGGPNSPQAAYERGVAADRRGIEPQARSAYEQALQRDPSFAPARLSLGISYCRTGEYDKAEKYLAALLSQNEKSADAHYYLGLVRRGQARPAEAASEFETALRLGFREAPVRSVLGELALSSGDYSRAVTQLETAVRLSARDIKSGALLTLAERLQGKLGDAETRINGIVSEFPIDYFALEEQRRVLKARGKDAEAGRAEAELWRLLSRDPDSALELSFDYFGVNRREEAAAVLEQAAKRMRYPMLNYTLGYVYSLAGKQDSAREQFIEGARLSPAYVFPHRIEEIDVLRAATKANPADGRAAYYLGNALAGNCRFTEAEAAWRDAVRLDASNAIAHRNLASILATNPASRKEAVAEYQLAIEHAPEDFRLYAEISAALRSDVPARIRVLESAPSAVRQKPTVAQALSVAYIEAGRFEDAIRLLETTEFSAAEGESGIYRDYRRAHMGLAAQYGKAGDHGKAGAEMLKALECPRNLSVALAASATPPRDFVGAAKELELGGRHAEAETAWQRAAEIPIETGLGVDHYYRAVALERLGRKDEARTVYSQLAAAADPKLKPADRALLTGLGMKGLGRSAEARSSLEQALKLNSRLDTAREALSEIKK